MGSQLENWQEEALALNAKEQKVRQELEQMVTEILPVGVGALSWITLQLEVRGWERFHNRRQVAVIPDCAPVSTTAMVGDGRAALTDAGTP